MSGVGVDLIEIDRVEAALARRPRLAERLFTQAERSYAASRPRPGQHLAARFCAKEAVSKALALDVLRPREVEVLGGGGPPTLALHGVAAARADALGVTVLISLTHTRTTAAAVAVLSSDAVTAPSPDAAVAPSPDPPGAPSPDAMDTP